MDKRESDSYEEEADDDEEEDDCVFVKAWNFNEPQLKQKGRKRRATSDPLPGKKVKNTSPERVKDQTTSDKTSSLIEESKVSSSTSISNETSKSLKCSNEYSSCSTCNESDSIKTIDVSDETNTYIKDISDPESSSNDAKSSSNSEDDSRDSTGQNIQETIGTSDIKDALKENTNSSRVSKSLFTDVGSRNPTNSDFCRPSTSNSIFDEDTGLYRNEVSDIDCDGVVDHETAAALKDPTKPVTWGVFLRDERDDENQGSSVNLSNKYVMEESEQEKETESELKAGLEPEQETVDEISQCDHFDEERDVVDEIGQVMEPRNSEGGQCSHCEEEGEESDEYVSDGNEDFSLNSFADTPGQVEDSAGPSTRRTRGNTVDNSALAGSIRNRRRDFGYPPRISDQTHSPPESESPTDVYAWLSRFTSWSGSERLRAIEMLIKQCSADQVRHMLVIIEPLLKRDFISHLPEEVALHILSYLSPEDMLRAAATSTKWRFLSDDNLLWKEQCHRIGITSISKRIRLMPVSYTSSWKAEYMRNKYIEHKWLTKPMSSAKILKAHDDHVITCLQFYGNIILSGSDDTTLKLWSAITGKCLRTLVGHTGGVWSSQMYKKTVISGSTDRTLRVWDADTGACLKILTGHTSTVRCMHLHEDRVVSGSRDATLRVWSVSEGQCLKVLVGHLAAVRCVQYDGKLVVSGAYDYYVKVWNPDTGECLHTLAGHTNRVYSLQFDGTHIVSGSLDTSIIVWDVTSGAIKHSLTGHQSLTSGMELRGNILVSGNADSTVKVWDIITGQCLHTLAGPHKHQSAVTCLQLNNRFVITSSDDGTVKLWDVKTGEFIRNLVTLESGGSGGVVWRIRASQTKLVCAVGSRNGTEETKLMVMNFDVPSTCQACH